jgi:hypothetical protein
MANIRDVVAYLCERFPHQDALSKARLTKMVYLADWRSAITRGRQLTDVEWRFNHYGPYVAHVVDTVRGDPLFDVIETENAMGHPKELVKLRGGYSNGSLAPQEQAILDYVIRTTAPLNWSEFINLVYSTYPIMAQPRYSDLDLVALAHDYEQAKPLLDASG